MEIQVVAQAIEPLELRPPDEQVPPLVVGILLVVVLRGRRGWSVSIS